MVSPVVATQDISSWPGAVPSPHISMISFQDDEDIIAKNLGSFLKVMDSSLGAVLPKEPGHPFSVFKGTNVEKFASKQTGVEYYTLQSSEESKKVFMEAKRKLERTIQDFYNKAKGITLPTADQASIPVKKEATLKTTEILGFPHLSLTKKIELPVLPNDFWQKNPVIIMGYQVIYSFEFSIVGKTIRLPQIYIEKWFGDISFHFSGQQGVLWYKNGPSSSAARSSGGTHISANPFNIYIDLGKARVMAEATLPQKPSKHLLEGEKDSGDKRKKLDGQ